MKAEDVQGGGKGVGGEGCRRMGGRGGGMKD